MITKLFYFGVQTLGGEGGGGQEKFGQNPYFHLKKIKIGTYFSTLLAVLIMLRGALEVV